MAPPKNVLTPELAARLHKGVTMLFSAAVTVAAGFAAFLIVTIDELSTMHHLDWLFVLLPVAFLGLLVTGLGFIRSVTAELAGTESAPRKTVDYGVQESQYDAPKRPVAPEPVARPVRSPIEPPAAMYRATPAPAPSKKTASAPSPRPAVQWEEWVGQKLLQKVGIVVVLIGMLVLLQQAFENRWIDELGRVFLALVASAAMLGAGEWFRSKYPQWSQGFTGGGLALAYLAVWVAHVLYADALLARYGFVVPASVAFGLYGCITAVGVLLSIRYDARTVAWFAVAGGYATPLLVDAASPNPYVFAAYLGVLAAGLLALSAHKHWPGIVLASFALTEFFLTRVFALPSLPNGAQAAIAIAFFAIFAVLPLVKHFRLKEKSNEEDLILIVGNAVAVYLSIQDALGGWQSEWVTLLCLALAAFAIACSVAALRVRGEDLVLGDTYLLGSVALVALALYHQLGIEWLALGWAPYAALVLHLGAYLKRSSVWAAGQLLLAGSAIALLVNLPLFTETESSWRPFLSNWSLQSYVAIASFIATVPAAKRAPKDLPGAPVIETVLHALLAILAFCIVTFEVTALHWATSVPLAGAYLAYAAVAALLFLWNRQITWFVAALAAQALVFIIVFLRGDHAGMDALWLLDATRGAGVFPLVHPWALVSLCATATLVGLLAVAMRGDGHPLLPRVQVRHLLLGMIVAQVWLHVSVEIQHAAGWFGWSDLAYQRALSAWWIAVAFAVGHVSWTPRWRYAAIALLALPFLKDLGRVTDPGSPMFDTVAWTIVLLAVAFYGAQTKKTEYLRSGVAGFLLFGAVDMLAHMGSRDAGTLRTVWWAVAGLLSMMSGFALKTPLLRQAAIAVFAATVAKLLLVDFSVLETPVRILASIATGLLLIGASYLYQRYGTDADKR